MLLINCTVCSSESVELLEDVAEFNNAARILWESVILTRFSLSSVVSSSLTDIVSVLICCCIFENEIFSNLRPLVTISNWPGLSKIEERDSCVSWTAKNFRAVLFPTPSILNPEIINYYKTMVFEKFKVERSKRTHRSHNMLNQINTVLQSQSWCSQNYFQEPELEPEP